MYQPYEDILELAGDREPLWWDSNGVPRYKPFHPSLVPNIYATEAVLVEIQCQSCRRLFDVAFEWQITDHLFCREFAELKGKKLEKALDGTKLTSQIKRGELPFYGDTPWHTVNGGQCAGTTMTSDTIRVKQIWVMSNETHEWELRERGSKRD
jgi:hypothetical protein